MLAAVKVVLDPVTPELIRDAAARIAAAASSPARVILFGSQARGDARADSDIDFLVVEEHVDDRFHEAGRLRVALYDLRVPIDIIVIGDDQVAAPSSLAIADALAEGVVVHERRAPAA
jgi:predicted nucleotidyltransferase